MRGSSALPQLMRHDISTKRDGAGAIFISREWLAHICAGVWVWHAGAVREWICVCVHRNALHHHIPYASSSPL